MESSKNINYKRKNYFLLTTGVIATILVFTFAFINYISYQSAWNETHYGTSQNNAIAPLFNGWITPCKHKPQNRILDLDFVAVDTLFGDYDLEIWRMDMEPSKGVVALFHTHQEAKSSLWNEAKSFYRMGYTVVMVDFRGAGNSTGTQSTLGYHEALDVTRVQDWCRQMYPTKKITLYGMFTGASAILRAVAETGAQPDAIILQSPFLSLSEYLTNQIKNRTLQHRFNGYLQSYWMGFIYQFNGLKYAPLRYAKNVHCPTLLIHGMRDKQLTYEDASAIFQNLSGKKELAVFGKSGHESILNNEEANWVYLVTNFMETTHQ